MPVKVSYQAAKFGGHRHCDGRDKMILASHAI